MLPDNHRNSSRHNFRDANVAEERIRNPEHLNGSCEATIRDYKRSIRAIRDASLASIVYQGATVPVFLVYLWGGQNKHYKPKQASPSGAVQQCRTITCLQTGNAVHAGLTIDRHLQPYNQSVTVHGSLA